MRRYLEHFLDLCKNRIFVMLCGVIVLFAIIVLRLFSLQIINMNAGPRSRFRDEKRNGSLLFKGIGYIRI